MHFQDFSQVLKVLLRVVRAHQNIIHVRHCTSQGYSFQHLRNQAAVGGGSIAQAEGHPFELVRSQGAHERRLVTMIPPHRDTVEGPAAVQAAEDLCPGQPGQVVGHQGQLDRVEVGAGVQGPVVDAPPDFSRGLLDRYQGRGPGRVAGFYDVLLEPVVQLLLQALLQLGVERPDPGPHGRAVGRVDLVSHQFTFPWGPIQGKCIKMAHQDHN